MASTQELASRYSSQLSQLKAIFPTWDEGDLAFTLQDTKGNVDEAAMMITEGRASTFTQATTRKKPVKGFEKPQGRSHSNRNADSGGWEAVNGEGEGGRAGRGGRGGRGGARGGRGGRGGEPFRGGARGGRGGRGGRGAYSGTNGVNGHKQGDFPTSTATSPEEWAAQVEQSNAAEEAEAAQEDKPEESTIPEASKGDDFASAGGWGDAPSKKELDIAAKTGGTGWQAEIKKPVPAAPTNPALKPKMTWAQIAKPQEKPKPTPPPPAAKPAAPITSDEPVAQEAAAEPEPESKDEPAEEAVPEPAPEEESHANGEMEELLPEVPDSAQADDSWATDPAIAGSGASAPWSKPSQPAAPLVPEPATTYTGPPGFNTVVSKSQATSQPRTSSRAAQRYKTADDQGVVLPPAMTQTLSSMEMQFGSLSFGGSNGDGVEAPAPEPKAETPAAPVAASLPAVTSPVRAPAAPQSAAVQPPPSSQPAPAQSQYPQPTSQPSAAAQQPAQPAYASPHQTLQQQMHAYQAHQNQWQQQQAQQQQQSQQSQQTQQTPSQTSQQDGLHQQQQYGQQYRGGHQDYYSTPGGQSQNDSHHPSAQAAQNASPYDQSFGAFGGSHGFGGQQGQGYQANDYGRGAYESQAGNYGRPPADDNKTPASAAQSHTPSNPAQPHIPQQQSQYYNQMGYYPSAPYNPYYQYGQAPNPGGFQQYYPLAQQQQRNPYGQPQPPAPAPIPGAKQSTPSAQSPYGSAPSGYQSGGSAFEDSSYSSLGGRFDNRTPNQQQASNTSYPSSYSSQHIHNVLGMSGGNAAAGNRQQAGTPEESFKSGAQVGQGAGGRASAQSVPAQGQTAQQQQQAAQQQQQQAAQQQQQQQQHGNNPAFGGYGGYGGYGNQDWSQYGYAGGRGGQSYGGWQQ